MKTYNILVWINPEIEEIQVIASKEINSSFTDKDLYICNTERNFMTSYVCQNDSIENAEKEAISYVEELERQDIISVDEYLNIRKQQEADQYYKFEEQDF